MNEFLWVEKYRPKNIEHCILPDDLKKTFKSFVDNNGFLFLIFTGFPFGSEAKSFLV